MLGECIVGASPAIIGVVRAESLDVSGVDMIHEDARNINRIFLKVIE